RTIVRYVEENAKPNADRLREFRESNLESLRHGLLAESPIHTDLETLKLGDSLAYWMETTPNDPLIPQVLAGKSPHARAAELVGGTKLADPAFRKSLIEGGKAAIEASNDPMIQVARLVDPRARELRRISETQIQEPQRQAYAKIANARFAISGTSVYPDATFTLRLGFGTAKGWDGAGEKFPWATTIGGAFEHAEAHGNVPPFKLPDSWMKARPRLNLATPYNFVSTTDIIGGNSGSPVFNKDGEYVGIVFDMNIPSLVYNYAFKEEDARTVNVHSAGMTESLRNVYGATELLQELGVGAGAAAATPRPRGEKK
ncbi:MAG: S46 family peptidase, partial [Thermoanaerobaculia bacterium]